jgi:pseudouridine-5'-phosphate glycosidase
MLSQIPEISPNLIEYSEEVLKAKQSNLPIVALESTIITHGMEYPINYTTASKVEETVRQNGAVPATIVILKGKIHVGLSNEKLKEISENKSDFIKCSTRDIPYALLKKKNGSTTVAATMFISNLAGIKVFVTGGIGGVHYGNDMDISTDLVELSRTPVTVICAGAKSILDIPRTMEFLETFSVPVVGFGCDKFPEFFFANGDCDVKIRMDSEKEIAELIDMSFNQLKMKNGILVGVPVPEEAGVDKSKIKEAIKEALNECEKLKIKGNKITPFLLKKINDLTNGESCDTNVKLIINNAKVGAGICKGLFELMKEGK